MDKKDLIQLFSIKRLSPVDGMAVTSAVWEEAHAYHRQRQQMHALFCHGPGIVTGLDVIASDPPDSSVYILPGIAVDAFGRTIVLTEPTAYDLGSAHGRLHLLLSYGESRPRPDDSRDGQGAPLYVYPEFGIEARQGLPDAASVELVRIQRQDGGSPIMDAQDAAHPRANELDLRFRQQVEAAPQRLAALAVSYAGERKIEHHGKGASYLARALRRSGDLRVWVDQDVSLAPGLERYTLVYLVAQEAFQLSSDEMQVLFDYVQGGGTLLLESCRRESDDGAPPADAAFADVLQSLGFSVHDLASGHELLVDPFLFAAPPPGYDPASVQVGDGVIWSTCDYGCLWGGERRGTTPSREEIRSAMEWGANILAYALARRQRINGK